MIRFSPLPVYSVGFRGLWDRAFRPWMELTPQMVADIHLQGGTILGSSRGGMDDEKVSLIVDSCIVRHLHPLHSPFLTHDSSYYYYK